MKSYLKLLLFLSLSFFSCRTAVKENDIKQPQTSPVDTQKTSTEPIKGRLTGDTLIIQQRCAVFYAPDSVQMEKRMKLVGEEEFRAGADDYIYYINTSVDYLEKQYLSVINAKDRKYISFITADKRSQLIKLDTLEELWGIYLFDPNKKPYHSDLTIIEEEYKEYFK
jgi:hypothetical protein